MQYVPHPSLNNVDPNDQPRKLTPDEIEYIVDGVPQNPCPDPIFSQMYRSQLQDILRENLQSVPLPPKEIVSMRNMVVQYHINSLIERGTAIGFQAAEAAGATLTQMILNAFHSSGGAESSQGIEGVKDSFFARQNLNNPLAYIFFEDKSTSAEDIISVYRSRLVGVNIKMLIKDSILIDMPDFVPEWWHAGEIIPDSKVVLRIFFDTSKLLEYQVSLQDIWIAIMRGPGNSDMIKCIYSSMKYGIIDIFCLETSKDIQSFIEDANQINTLCSNSLKMTPLPDSYFMKDIKPYTTRYLAECNVLNAIVLESMGCIRLKGIAGIKNLRPSRMSKGPLSLIVKEEQAYIPGDQLSQDGRVWLISISVHKMNETGIPLESLELLLKEVGIQIRKDPGNPDHLLLLTPEASFRADDGNIMAKDGNNYFIQLKNLDGYVQVQETGRWLKHLGPDNLEYLDNLKVWNQKVTENYSVKRPDVVTLDGKHYVPVDLVNVDGIWYELAIQGYIGRPMKPTEYVNYLLKIDKDKFEEERKTNRNAKRSRLINLSNYVYAVAELDNTNKTAYKNILKNLLCIPYIDSKRTYTNDMHMIRDTLGIEAAFIYNYNNITTMIRSKGAYINAANIVNIVESICNRGWCYGATLNGISRQMAGHLSLSSVGGAGDNIISSAIAKQKESRNNSTAAVFMGCRSRVGTGYFYVAMRTIRDGQEKIVMDDECYDALNKDDRYKDEIQRVKDEANRRSMARQSRMTERKEHEQNDEVDDEETLGVVYVSPGNTEEIQEDDPERVTKPLTSVVGAPDAPLMNTISRTMFTNTKGRSVIRGSLSRRPQVLDGTEGDVDTMKAEKMERVITRSPLRPPGATGPPLTGLVTREAPRPETRDIMRLVGGDMRNESRVGGDTEARDVRVGIPGLVSAQVPRTSLASSLRPSAPPSPPTTFITKSPPRSPVNPRAAAIFGGGLKQRPALAPIQPGARQANTGTAAVDRLDELFG